MRLLPNIRKILPRSTIIWRISSIIRLTGSWCWKKNTARTIHVWPRCATSTRSRRPKWLRRMRNCISTVPKDLSGQVWRRMNLSATVPTSTILFFSIATVHTRLWKWARKCSSEGISFTWMCSSGMITARSIMWSTEMERWVIIISSVLP